jgi:DNA-binding transcriptional LysR family regulator
MVSMQMDIHEMRSLLLIAEEMNLTRAAERLLHLLI